MEGVNVIGYARVSSDEQADKGYSLDYQKDYIERYCSTKRYNLVRDVYIEDFSAKTFNRPEYKNMKEFAPKKSNKVNMILVIRWDRFARELSDALVQIKRFQEQGIEVNSIEQHIDYGQADYIVMLAMYLATSHAERLKTSRRVKESYNKARLNGKYTSQPPKGYYWKKHTRDEPSELLVNEHEASLVRVAFDLYSTGLYSADVVRKKMLEQGLNVRSKQNFLNLLRNRLYVGDVHVPGFNGNPEKWVVGTHRPIIDRDLFYRVQELLDGKKKNHPKAKLKMMPGLYLRNFLTCPVCGGNLTGSYSRGRNGNRYPYYHCNHTGHQRFSATRANRSFVQLLDSFKPSREVVELFKVVVADLQDEQRMDTATRLTMLDKDIMETTKKIDEADDLLIAGKITSETHERYINRHQQVIRDLDSQREMLKDSNMKETREKINYSLNILENLGYYFEKADTEGKVKIIGSIFPEKIQFLENEYRTATINEVITKIAMIPKELQSVEKEKTDISVGLSCLAPQVGLEPTTYGLTVRRSNQLSY